MCAECSGVIVSLNHTPTRDVSGDTREPHAEETHNSDDTPTSGECCRPGWEQTLGLDVLMFKHFLFGNLSLWLMPQRIRTPESKMKVSIWGKKHSSDEESRQKTGPCINCCTLCPLHLHHSVMLNVMQDKTEAHRMLMPHLFLLYHFYLLSSFYFLVSVEVILDAELSLYLFSPHFYKITVKNICLWWACLKQICTFFSFFKLTMKHQERTHVWDNVYSQQKSQNHREDQTNVLSLFFLHINI